MLVWQRTNGPYGGNVRSIAINSQGHIFVGDYGIYRSTDNGSSWSFVDLNGVSVTALAVNDFNGDIYATDSGQISIPSPPSWVSTPPPPRISSSPS